MAWLFRRNNRTNEDMSLPEDGWLAIVPDYQPEDKTATIVAEPSIQTRIQERIKTYMGEKETYIVTNEIKSTIFRDVFTHLSMRWIGEIGEIVGSERELTWYPQANTKNILGGMIDIANCTCPNKLTIKGLAQCIKAVNISVIHSLDVSQQEQKDKILEIILMSVPYIIDIWMKLSK